MAEAFAESDAAAQEDATLQISKAELAAIRQSASNPAINVEMLREINRNRAFEPQEEDDATQTFDRSSLETLLEADSAVTDEVVDAAYTNAAVEQARQEEVDPETVQFDLDEEPSLADFAGQGLDELSDADLHAVVFGDASEPEQPEPSEQPPRIHYPDPPDRADAFDLFDVSEEDSGRFPPPAQVEDDFDGLDELSDADLHAVVFGDELSDASEEAEAEPDPLADPEFEALEELTADDLIEEEELPDSGTPVAGPPEFSEPRPPVSDTVADNPAPEDFRGAESRLLSIGATLGSLAMLAAGSLRIATADMLTFLHPVVAGMMVAIGLLVLMGIFVSFLKHRQ